MSGGENFPLDIQIPSTSTTVQEVSKEPSTPTYSSIKIDESQTSQGRDPSVTTSHTNDSFVPDVKKLDEPLPKPWRDFESWIYYHAGTIFVTRPRLLSIALLYRLTWPRILVILDVWTDINIASQLYAGGYSLYFALSSLFIASPLMFTWCVSLRLVQSLITKFQNHLDMQHQSKQDSTRHTLHRVFLYIFVILYIFPPIGLLSILFHIC